MNNLTIFGCNHLGFFATHRLDKNTEIVETFNGDNYFITYVKPNYLKNIIKNHNKFHGLIDGSHYMECNSWRESFEMLDKIYDEHKFEKIYVFFTPLIDSYSFGKESKIPELYNKCLNDDKFGFSFSSIKNYYKRILMIYHLNQKYDIPIIQFVDDPLEADFSKLNNKNKRYFYYKNDRINCEYYPYVEYGFVYKNKREYSTEKKYDFVFGMTSVMKTVDYRNQMIGKLLDLENKFKNHEINYKFFFKDKSRNINSYVNGFKYNDEFIAQAKYTMVIPAYDVNEFSLIRLIEAIDRKCIPLIHIDCNSWERAMKHFPDLIRIYKKYELFTDEDSLIFKIKSLYYDIIIEELRQSPDYVQLLFQPYYESYKI